ncbi:MAG: threonine/serine exporter family protein [Anaerolineae bacterium]|nr:threonine/serine exporter family protein [Anaerolineae bacterium]
MSRSIRHHQRTFTQTELAAALQVVLRIGALVLRSGAASFRTQEVMERCAAALGIERLEAYVTPTGIIASAYSDCEHRTQIKQVRGLAVDMNRVIALELLSRTLPLGIEAAELHKRIDEIEAQGMLYPRWVVTIMVGLACGAFSVIIGGSALEFAAAFSGAAIAQTLRMALIKQHLSPVPIVVICAAVAAGVCYALLRAFAPIYTLLNIQPSLQNGVIASVLLLVPGVPLITALLDLVNLDLVSGLSRGIYAVLILACIAIGMLAILLVTGFSIV